MTFPPDAESFRLTPARVLKLTEKELADHDCFCVICERGTGTPTEDSQEGFPMPGVCPSCWRRPSVWLFTFVWNTRGALADRWSRVVDTACRFLGGDRFVVASSWGAIAHPITAVGRMFAAVTLCRLAGHRLDGSELEVDMETGEGMAWCCHCDIAHRLSAPELRAIHNIPGPYGPSTEESLADFGVAVPRPRLRAVPPEEEGDPA